MARLRRAAHAKRKAREIFDFARFSFLIRYDRLQIGDFYKVQPKGAGMGYDVEKEMEKCARKGISHNFDLSSDQYILKARKLTLERAFERSEKVYIVPLNRRDATHYLALKSEILACARRCDIYVVLHTRLRGCDLDRGLRGCIGVHVVYISKEHFRMAFMSAGDGYCMVVGENMKIVANFCDRKIAEELFSSIPKTETV